MAVASPEAAHTEDRRSPTRDSEGAEIVEQPLAQVVEDMIYVAVGKDVKECKLNLLWALQNSGGKKVCVLHVHQPAQFIPLMGTRFPASALKDQEVQAYREIERQHMNKLLDEYISICRGMGVRVEKLHVEMDSIEKGIVDLIIKHGIKKLVMGAAANRQYSKKMTDLKSKKAIYARLQAPASCHIWFVCKGYLILTREGISKIELRSLSLKEAPITKPEVPIHLRSQSTMAEQDALNTSHQQRRVSSNPSDLNREKFSASPPRDESEVQSSPQTREANGILEDWDGLSRNSFRSSFRSSRFSTYSSVGMAEGSFSPLMVKDVRIVGSELSEPPPSLLEGSIEDDLYDQLRQAMAEAENSRREAFEEAVRRAKAEKDALDAVRRARAAENLYAEERRLRREAEEALAKEMDELEKLKIQREEAMEELKKAQKQKLLVESQLDDSCRTEKEIEQKVVSAVALLQNYKKERDELLIERDKALKQAEELRKGQMEASGTHIPRFYSTISFFEIEEATRRFDPSLKIGEGGYGSIYKGVLRHTSVAIKRLNPQSTQGPAEFQQEVEVLSRLRHPNLVTLIGACPEAWTLIYEYLPNGSLEDRLNCKDNTPPLSWQTRIRIATGLCSVLIFLHSSKPLSIVHGDLKPSNVLLDASFVCKLSDFGICRLISNENNSGDTSTIICRTDPKGTFTYLDPEFLATGEITPKSDVYSFGIILLQLLTGRPALGITKEVQYAMDQGNLQQLLDPLAGDWPYMLAERLAELALRCTEISRKNRPDLVSDVWRILESMKAACGNSTSRWSSKEHHQPPSYFICPIFQEIMQNPQLAADGFTYEAEAIRGWLSNGHDTSPVTSEELAHQELVPNHALRSAIQEWLQ